ncbi:MAG: hypothetical protein VX910_08845 [Candidatus Latescibacterota bacterium]|nr:hypothetical protein [Candidatus Latescibacterota bacterium]
MFYPDSLLTAIRNNADQQDWALTGCEKIVANTNLWIRQNDETLWDAMFSPDLKRSYVVWSSGHCPARKQGISMYKWEIDPITRPWKVMCPSCRELFPKNDFQTYYRSGIDAHGVFEERLADQSLLVAGQETAEQGGQ